MNLKSVKDGKTLDEVERFRRDERERRRLEQLADYTYKLLFVLRYVSLCGAWNDEMKEIVELLHEINC